MIAITRSINLGNSITIPLLINMYDKGEINNSSIWKIVKPSIEDILSKDNRDKEDILQGEITLWITSMELLCQKGNIIPGTRIEISFKDTIITTKSCRRRGSILDATKYKYTVLDMQNKSCGF